MIAVQEIDTRGLTSLINGLSNALISQGGDCSQVVKDETRLLAAECGKISGPRNRQKKFNSIPKEIGRVFAPLPAKPWGIKKRGHGDMLWLNSGEHFLTGVRRSRVLSESPSMETMFRAFIMADGKMGKKYSVIGERGKQNVQEINRIMVKRSSFSQFTRFVQSHMGRMKATWFATAKKIEPSTEVPKWIARHIDGNPKAITDLTGLQNSESPSTVFGSKAIGIGKFRDEINAAVKSRETKVAAKIKLILSGYSKDVAHGIKIRRHGKDAHES